MAKIVIVVEGGVVQDVLTDDASCEVTLIDYDNYPDAEIPKELTRLETAEIIEIKNGVHHISSIERHADRPLE